jgi:hypothetical protein
MEEIKKLIDSKIKEWETKKTTSKNPNFLIAANAKLEILNEVNDEINKLKI